MFGIDCSLFNADAHRRRVSVNACKLRMRAKRILLLYVYLFEDGFGFHPMFRIFSWNHWWYNVDSHARALGNVRFHARPSPLLTRISQYRRELGRGLLQADRLTPSIVTSCHCRKQAKSIKIHLVGRIVFWSVVDAACDEAKISKDQQREPSEGGTSCSFMLSFLHPSRSSRCLTDKPFFLYGLIPICLQTFGLVPWLQGAEPTRSFDVICHVSWRDGHINFIRS